MTDQHRASPADWLLHAASLDDADSSCILELRDRIAALEAAQLEQAESNRFCTDAIVRRVEALEDPMAELRAASAEARPAGLVEQVSKRIEFGIDANQDPEGITRAAIREVAAWLRSVGNNGSADELEQQANHD